MSINSNEFLSLKKRYEEAKDNLKYYYKDDPLYFIEKLEEITDEILKDLAAHKLGNDMYYEVYPPEEDKEEPWHPCYTK